MGVISTEGTMQSQEYLHAIREANPTIGVLPKAAPQLVDLVEAGKSDAPETEAALREAHEEVGLKRDFIEPIGYLDLYGTAFGFRILPTVARVKPGFELKINEAEVVDSFEVPLAFLMNPENHQIHSKEFRGMERSYYAMPFAERYIWGATAGILRVLYERIYLA